MYKILPATKMPLISSSTDLMMPRQSSSPPTHKRSLGGRSASQHHHHFSLRKTLIIPILFACIYLWQFHVRYFAKVDDKELKDNFAWAPELADRKNKIRGRIKEVVSGLLQAIPTTEITKQKERVYCMVPFIWTPSALHAYHAIHASWGKRCDILRFFIDPIIGDNTTGYYNMTEPSEVLAAQNVGGDMALPHDVVILHNMRRPWNTCGVEDNKKQNKPAGNCRNIFEKVWRMMVYVGDGSGGTCIGDARLAEQDGIKLGADRAEWFVKVDQDTFLFPENVPRYAESKKWTYDDYHYFGHVLNHRRSDRGVSIVAGGAVFYSKAALLAAADAFQTMPLEKGDQEEDGTCRDAYTGTEEVVTAVCLKQHSNITAEPAIDIEGREYVSLYEVDDILGYNRTQHGEWWFWELKKRYPCHDNPRDCLAHLPLAFHHYKDSKFFLDFENEFYGSVVEKRAPISNAGRSAARNWRRFDDTYNYFERIRAAMKVAKDRESSQQQSSLSVSNNAHQQQPEEGTAAHNNNRLYCMVPFIWSSKYVHSYHAIIKTWGQRCDVIKFFVDPIIGDKETGFHDMRTNSSTYTLPNDVIVVHDMKRPWNVCLDYKEGNCRNIWEKIWRSWIWVDDHGDTNTADWFVKIDADSYLFPENMKRYIIDKKWSADDHHYFGHKLKHKDGTGFPPLIAGAAVFMSRATVKAAASIFRKFDSEKSDAWGARCQDEHTDQEEPITAVCLKNHFDIDAVETLDDAGQELVIVGEIEDVLLWNRTEQGEWWYWQNKPKIHPITGKDNMHHCCGTLPIAFHGYKDSQWFFKLEAEFYAEAVSDAGDGWKQYRWRNPVETNKYFGEVRAAMKEAGKFDL